MTEETTELTVIPRNLDADADAAVAVPFIVGVGASAGGLEALTGLLANVEVRPDLAFVVVQHLSPDYKSVIVELVARSTKFRVFRALDGEVIRGGCVYVIEPRTVLLVRGAKLVVRSQERSSHIHLPVDVLFQSLAEDQGSNAAVIVLSGTGSDGTRGCRLVKELGGLVIAQNAESSAFDGMPRSIRTAGLADIVLPPSMMIEELSRVLKAGGLESEGLLDDERQVVLNRILSILRRDASLDFGHYKSSTIVRRIRRRLGVLGYSPEEYAERLDADEAERALLVQDMLIGVTRFFRDAPAFELLQGQIYNYLEANPDRTLRIWVAGSSTGEEAYTVAMIVSEVVRLMAPERSFKIFATDVNQEALRQASMGAYSTSAVADISADLLRRYFERTGDGTFIASQDLRSKILFSRHNVFQDPPFSDLDVVVCRNLLIYLRSKVQERVYQNFAFSLRRGGIVLFGPSESPPNKLDDFESVEPRWQIYRALGKSSRTGAMVVRGTDSQSPIRVGPIPSMRRDIELLDIFRGLLPTYVPPFIVLDSDFSLVYRTGDLGGFLKVPDGLATLDARQMFPDEFVQILSTVEQQLTKQTPARFGSMTVRSGDNSFCFELEARRIRESPLGRALLVLVFVGLHEEAGQVEVTPLPTLHFDGHERIRELEKQLGASRENLQATVEALESSNEELQSTNEELLASNEELQSLNEELQSVNEELHTVNAEFQTKIEELSLLNSDMDQLLRSIDVGALFLDKNLGIRRFNTPATRFINLLEQDVGRPLNHLSHDFGDAPLLELCRQALNGFEAVERLLVANTGSRILFRARGLTSEDPEGGLVLTFTDVTSVHAERQSRHMLDEALQRTDIPIAILELSGRIALANDAFARQFNRDAKWLRGLDVSQVLTEEEKAGFRAHVAGARKGRIWEGIVHSLTADGRLFHESVKLAPLRDEEGTVIGLMRLTEGTFEVGTLEKASVTGTYSWDVRADTNTCSASLYDVLGMSRDGPAPNMKSFYPLILEEERPMADDFLAKVMDATGPLEHSLRARREDGQVQRLGMRLLPDRLPTGELRKIIGVLWIVPEPTTPTEDLVEQAS